MTDTGYKKIKDSLMHIKNMKTFAIENELDKVNIIDVTPGKNGRRDSFTASLKFKKNPANEEWHFVRQGEWWMVDEIT